MSAKREVARTVAVTKEALDAMRAYEPAETTERVAYEQAAKLARVAYEQAMEAAWVAYKDALAEAEKEA